MSERPRMSKERRAEVVGRMRQMATDAWSERAAAMFRETADELEAAWESEGRLESAEKRIQAALDRAYRSGQVEGDHHRAWCIDQMVRELTGGGYEAWVRGAKDGADGPETYGWDTGTPP